MVAHFFLARNTWQRGEESMQFSSLEQAVACLAQLRARRKWWRRWARRSAVALLLREGASGPELLLIRRAERVGDRWSGHMGFPGGGLHSGDRHSLAAAMRETFEEIGVDLGQHARIVARLSDIVSVPHHGQRRPMVISPYVFAVDSLPALTFNDEVADALWVPLRFFADRANRGSIEWRHLRLGCYTWRGHQIWGLSLAMIDEMMRQLGVEPAQPGALKSTSR